ncbi:beta-lactamase hydrolase domain-containing protein [Thermomonas aquatica]|uniref:Beta-lactamase hydrolase-like protein phosphatase-like domain-containing protein n=1 Tax=Thermomonas aquatica TaxID=2202149 RepID=A0A5B7ZTG5_9GAMM|nr:sulfur transferase domain-containing protein [Thermomonas aquatica]QDA57833.1 hypothetical protein FHQ07_11200 [Thermomonas aquatica]
MKMELPLLLPILLACAACATPEPAVVPETAAMHDLPVPQLHVPRAGLVTGGQPEAVAWTVLARRGVATVVNLRPAAEMAGRDEAAEVSAAGMAYHAIPVDGAAGITLDKARALRSLLAAANGPVLVHCASGNRVGALIALGAADAGVPVDEALALGRAAGMTGAEARVRELLDASAQP